jgi:hypothetical protein
LDLGLPAPERGGFAHSTDASCCASRPWRHPSPRRRPRSRYACGGDPSSGVGLASLPDAGRPSEGWLPTPPFGRTGLTGLYADAGKRRGCLREAWRCMLPMELAAGTGPCSLTGNNRHLFPPAACLPNVNARGPCGPNPETRRGGLGASKLTLQLCVCLTMSHTLTPRHADH